MSLAPPRLRVGPGRAAVLALDALVGVLLLIVAVASGIGPGTSPAASSAPTGYELTTRLGDVAPPVQSTGFAVAPDGSLGLVDRSRQVIVRLDANGHPLTEWGPEFGPGVTAQDLVGLAVDQAGWYVLDRGAQRIIRLDSSGQVLPSGEIDLGPLGTYGPNGLTADGHGNLYLADTGRDRVLIFDSSGQMTGSIGDSGSALGEFKQPMFVAFGPDGSMLVTDWENERVERFDSQRHATNAWPVPGHAWGVAVDARGRVFVPDADHRLVRMFGTDGSVLAQFGSVDGGGPALPVDVPTQVGVSPDGSSLWILGLNGLIRADLSGLSDVRSSTAEAGWARAPLAILGAALLALAVGLSLVPLVRRSRVVGSLGVPSGTAAANLERERVSSSDRAPRGLLLSDLPLSADAALAVGLPLAGLGLVGAVLAEIAVASPLTRVDPWPRMLLLALASLVFAVGCGISARAVPWQWIAGWPACAKSPLPLGRPRRLFGLAGVVLAAVLSLVAAFVWRHFGFQTPEATTGALFWLGALGMTAATILWYAGALRPTRPTLWTLIPWLLFLVALLPRAWNNANLPYGVWFDEAEAGLQARRFLQEGRFTPITDTYGRDASLVYYFIAGAQAIIPDPILAARLVSALIGAACAPLIYFMGRELYGWRVGLVAGVVLAASRWHVDVSRLGWDPISLPFVAILAIWLLARAVRTARVTDAAWAGLAVGLGLHAYIGSRALPIVGLGMVLYAAWWLRWGTRDMVARFGLVALLALLAALPVVIFAIQDPAGFNGRLNQTLILNEPVSRAQQLSEIWSNVQKHLLMFHVSGDFNGRHNLPGLPMLDVVSGLLAMLGLGLLLSRPFDWRSIVLVGWGLASLLGGIMTFPFEAPQAMRSLGITPVLAMLVALGLLVTADRVLVLTRARWAGRAVAALAAASVALIAWINLTTFFGAQMNDPVVWEAFSTRETIPSRVLRDAGRPLEAILGSPTIAPSLQQALIVPDQQDRIRTFDASADLPYRGSGPAIVILETEHEAGLADEVARYYPDATRIAVMPPNGLRPTVNEIELEPRMLAAQRGLQANGDTWRGLIALDQTGAYAFRSPLGGAVTIDGTSIAPTEHLELPRGNHLVSVGAPRPLLEWQTPGAIQWQPVDPSVLFVAPDGGTGLQATFYPTANFTGGQTEVIIDPVVAHYYHHNPFARSNIAPSLWSVEWRGFIDIPVSGAYRFDADALTRAGLWIDERVVFDTLGADTGMNGPAQLTAGRHAIRVRLSNRGDGGPRMYLYWTPPNGARGLVPGQLLYSPAPSPRSTAP